MEWESRRIKRVLRSIVREHGRRYLGGRLLDIGCGIKPYKQVLASSVAEHIGVDHEGTLFGLEHVDIVATAYQLPIGDSSFDSALVTEVLEHLEDPIAALSECARVLRVGGHVLITTPFMWHLHDEPRDFYRFTPHGLRHVIESAGLEVVEIQMVGGFWSTFGQLLAYVLETYDRGRIRKLGILPLLGLASQRLGAMADRRSLRRAWGSHVFAVARKPE